MRRIASHLLFDRGEVIPRPVVTVDDTGLIVSVGQWERLDGDASTEFYAGALCAGFVNAHCHLELSYLRGAIARGTGFAGFARAIGAVRGGFAMEDRLRALEAADARMWHEGVQAVADIVNGETSFAAKARSAVRYRSFAEVFGLNASTEAVRPLLLQYPDTTLTPHSTYSIQDTAFSEVVSDAANDPLSIHFMESDDEAALFRGEGPLAAWYGRMGWRCDFLSHGSPAGRVADMVPRGRRVLLVHGCRVGEAEYDMVSDRLGQTLWWVLCPRSNDYISGLRPPVELLRRHGARICVGTDSLASNECLSMVEELKLLDGVPLEEAVAWATVNGAQALGLDGGIGSIEAGKRPGLVLIENLSYDSAGAHLTAESRSRRLV
ncbi:MAG: amidohydrolase family protein [Bacteroidales bacterium]|nr:MAG: amidohydrolase family protein [Bacteroidales bacterium]